MLRRVRSRLKNYHTRKNSVDVINAIEFAHATGKCSYGIRNGLHDLVFLDKRELPDVALDKSLEIIFRVASFDQQIDFKVILSRLRLAYRLEIRHNCSKACGNKRVIAGDENSLFELPEFVEKEDKRTSI